MATSYFYVDANNEQQGPYAIPTIANLFTAGQINTETLVWNESLGGDWKKISDLPTLLNDMYVNPPQRSSPPVRSGSPPRGATPTYTHNRTNMANATPLNEASSMDMWVDPHPPRTPNSEWSKVRDVLFHNFQGDLKEMAKCMNNAQEAYLRQKDTVGNKGRQFAELCATHLLGEKYNPKAKYESLSSKIQRLRTANTHSATVLADLTSLLRLGNVASHPMTFPPAEKPTCIDAMYRLATTVIPKSGIVKSQTLEEFLAQLSLTKYLPAFEAQGALTVDDLHGVEKADFRQEFGMGLFEANRLFKAIGEREEDTREEEKKEEKEATKNSFLTADRVDCVQVLKGHTHDVFAVAKVSEDVVVSGSYDKTVRVWNWKTGKELQVLKGHTKAVNAVAVVSEDVVVSGSYDDTVRVWNWKSGKELQVLKGHTKAVNAVAVVSEDVVVSGSYDKTVRVWNWKTGKELQVLKGHTEAVIGVAVVSEDVVVSGSYDKTVRVWNWKTGKELQVLKGHTEWVIGVAKVSEDVVVSGSYDDTVRVWNWKSGKELQVLTGHTHTVYAVAKVSEDVVVSGSADKTVRVWNWKTGKELQVLRGHTEWAIGVAVVSEDVVVSGSWDDTVRVWKVVSSKK